MGISDGAVQVTTGIIDSLKNQPLSLALVVMNMCLLAFFYFLLSTVSNQREREIGLLYADKKEVRELLAKCVVPTQRTSADPTWEAIPLPLDVLVSGKAGAHP